MTPDGTLWWGDDAGIRSFDGATETSVPVLAERVNGIGRIDGDTAWVVGQGEAFQVDLTTGETWARTVLDAEGESRHFHAVTR